MSTLRIARADLRHAGKFTCAPSYAKPDTVTLHVVDGELVSELVPSAFIFSDAS